MERGKIMRKIITFEKIYIASKIFGKIILKHSSCNFKNAQVAF